MKLHSILLFITAGVASEAALAADVDYTKGVLVVNEDWYGHQNSTVNHLSPDAADGEYWTYRVVQAANPGHTLGCTNQYGAIWGDKVYYIAKQAKDPGDAVTGGRLTVCDLATMKIVAQLENIDPSGATADGRAFIGVSASKGYISTSNGVWVLDLDTNTVTGQVSGTENPNGSGSGSATDSGGSLYHGQCGMMVKAAGRVFVAHQAYGLLVVDPAADRVTQTLSMADLAGVDGAGIGSVVLAADGCLWLSVAKDISGMGTALNMLVKLDPASLTHETVTLDTGVYGPSNSWYAWTPDTFCASTQRRALYWTGGSSSWFVGNNVYRLDLDTMVTTRIIDFASLDGSWKVYGASLRVDPLSDELYMTLFHNFNNNTYMTRRTDYMGNIIKDYAMVRNYWFPSLFIFPEAALAGIEPVSTDAAPVNGIMLRDGSLSVTGLAGSELGVYTLTGARVLSAGVTTADESVDVSYLPTGIYVARAGSCALRFAL